MNEPSFASSSSRSTAYVNPEGAGGSSQSSATSASGETSRSEDSVFVPGATSASARGSASGSEQDPETTAEVSVGDEYKSILVWRNGASGLTYMWSLEGASTTDSSLLQFDLGPTWAIAGIADFDGNGQVDLLWQDQTTGQLALSTLQDNQLAQPVVYLTANPGIAWTVAATVDFNQDGRGDILWRNSQTGENTIWFMNDQGQASSSTNLAPVVGADWSIGGAGDFNGDGYNDILWQNTNSDTLTVWLMQGSETVGEILTIDAPMGSTWTVAGVGDFNQDRYADILWRDATGTISIWLMNGSQIIGESILPSNFNHDWQTVV